MTVYYTTRGAVSNTVEFKTAQTFLDFSKVDVDEETGESPFKGTGTVYVYLNIISNDYTKADSAIVLSMQSLNDNPSFWTYYRRIGTLTFKDWVVTDLTQDNIGKPTVIGYYIRDTYAFRTIKVVSYAEGEPGKPVYRVDVRGGDVSLGTHNYSVAAKSYKLDKKVSVSYYGGLFSSYNLPNATQGEEVISESGWIYLKIYVDEDNFRGEILFTKTSDGLPVNSLEQEIVPIATVEYDEKQKVFYVSDYDHDYDYDYDLDHKRWG